MSDARQEVQKVLDGMGASGFVGAGLVSRDGLPVLMRFQRPVQEETFCAMSAALLGASEAALQELGDQRPAWAQVETEDLRLLVAGLDDSHLLVAVAPGKGDAAKMRAAMDVSRQNLRKILGG